jgi:sulfopyruvate decarboxylase subunit beta
MSMRRDECLRVLARLRRDEIVVATYQAAFDWLEIAPSDLNYVAIGAMGQASSHALGLALGRPDLTVIVLDGDGSLLMNLGSLVTIAAAAPPNLVHFVLENGCYEANGSHPLPGGDRLDFAGIARAAGIRSVFACGDLAEFERCLPQLLDAPGPVFAVLKIVAGPPPKQDYAYIHSAPTRDAFKRALRATPQGSR